LTMGHTLISQGSVVVPEGSLISQGYNMANFASSWATFVPTLFLGPLARNGGPTLTHALLPGSPAINAGVNSAVPGLAYDQRGQGFPRWVGSAIDIGAYEVQGTPIAVGLSAAAVAAPQFQALFPEQPPGVFWGSVAWGDYDNDGRLDLLLTGAATNDVIVAQLWRNTGNQGFQKVSIPELAGVVASAVAWGDFDNDGRLDFVLTGSDSSGLPRSELWWNTGAGFSNVTSRLAAGLPGVDSGSVAWADFNNDGRLDLFLTGLDFDFFPVSQLWQNTAGGFSNVTRQIAEGLPGLANSSVAWADYDQDGRMDFLITGSSDSLRSGATSQLWRNVGSEFIPVPIEELPGVYHGTVAWADFDNDGRLDFLLTGESEGGFVSQLWRNTSSGFSNVTSELAPGLPETAEGSVAWGDYDNDGRPDILLTGDSTLGYQISQLWRNTDAGFVQETNLALPPVRASSVAWADYDNDGRLDLLITGQHTNAVPIAEFPWNIQAVGNLPPAAPAGLSAQLNGSSLTLRWHPAVDDHGLPGGLSYNVVLSGSPEGIDLASPMARLGDGFRRVARLGGAGLRTSWTFTNLPPAAAYFWSVQAVDSAYAGGAFAPVQGVLNAALTELSFAAGQATVTFTGVSGWNYVVEYSDDLIVWRLGGTATESPVGSGNFIFQDANAPVGQRFYQIGYYP